MSAPPSIASEMEADLGTLPRIWAPEHRTFRARWSARLAAIDPPEVIAAVHHFEDGLEPHLKWIAYELIRCHRGAFWAINRGQIEELASRVTTWFAADAFATVLVGPLWAKARLPDEMFSEWSRSERLWLRRAAAVSTVGRNIKEADVANTLAICATLADDRSEYVEKGVSWALRYLAQKDRGAVGRFMAKHETHLGPIARYEVRHHLTTGQNRARRTAPS